MPDAGERLQIDDQAYEVAGKVSLTEGSGDNATTWAFYGLRRLSDGAKLYLEEDSGEKWSLYEIMPSDTAPPVLDAVDLERTINSVDDQAFGQFGEDQKLVWGTTSSPLRGAPAPFTGTRRLMVCRGTNEQYALATFYGQDLVQERVGVYYSAIWPAARIERAPVEPARFPASLLPINYAAALALGAAAFAPLLAPDLDLPIVSAFWWLGFVAWCATIVGRGGAHYVGAHIVASAYLLWFCTRVVDNYWMVHAGDSANGLIAAHIGVLIVGLTGLRFVSRRAYYMLADGAKWGGGIAFGGYVCGLLFASMMEEYWYGRHFAWYVGDSPWGYIWPPILILAIAYKVNDYKQVPMSFPDFARQTERLRAALKAGAGEVQRGALALTVVADDLGDAVKICDDPAVAALHNYRDGLYKVSNVVEKLSKLDPDEESMLDTERLNDDLRVLSDDLGKMVEQGRGAAGGSLRISPQVRVLL